MRTAAVMNYAKITWWILTLLYSVVIWKYRNCIGHYPIKIFTGIFKKINVRLETYADYRDCNFDENCRLVKKDDKVLEEMLYMRIEKEII
jgi:hypothetical protein